MKSCVKTHTHSSRSFPVPSMPPILFFNEQIISWEHYLKGSCILVENTSCMWTRLKCLWPQLVLPFMQPGSVSCTVIFSGEPWDHDTGVLSTKDPHGWVVLVDKGYQGAQQYLRAIIPKKNCMENYLLWMTKHLMPEL